MSRIHLLAIPANYFKYFQYISDLPGKQTQVLGANLIAVFWHLISYNEWAVTWAVCHFLKGSISSCEPSFLESSSGKEFMKNSLF